MESSVKENIKKELSEARIYGEGRRISIDIQKEEDLGDIKKLIQIKLDN